MDTGLNSITADRFVALVDVAGPFADGSVVAQRALADLFAAGVVRFGRRGLRGIGETLRASQRGTGG